MTETWRPIVGFEGVYAISDQGRVKRVTDGPGTWAGRILRSPCNSNGYPTVFLHRNGSVYRRTVHQLVAVAFLGPVPEGHEVNHRDGVRSNPRATNLEYATRGQNLLHAYRVLGRAPGGPPSGAAHPNSKLTAQQVAEIRRRYQPRAYSLATLAREYAVCAETVRRIVSGTAWKEGLT